MAVRRDNKGIWRYRKVVLYTNGQKVRISGTPAINTKAEAEAAERHHIERVLHPVAEKKEVVTFEWFVKEKWWPIYPKAAGNRPATVVEKELYLRRHLLPPLGRFKLDEIRGEKLERFFAGLTEKGLAPKTRKNIGAVLRRILASAFEWEYLEAIPRFPRIKVPDQPWDFYTPDETERIFAATVTPFERALILFACHTGARAGEQIALTWDDLDFVNHKVIIRRSSGKGRKALVGPTKSGHERKVDLTVTLEEALKELPHERSSLVFCHPGGRALSHWELRGILKRVCRRIGMRFTTWHTLRHTFGSQCAMRGVPLLLIQQWMGHSTIVMTMRYSHLSPNAGQEWISVLDGQSEENRGNHVAKVVRLFRNPLISERIVGGANRI